MHICFKGQLDELILYNIVYTANFYKLELHVIFLFVAFVRYSYAIDNAV